MAQHSQTLSKDSNTIYIDGQLNETIALEKLVLAYYNQIYRLAFSILDDPHEAEDAAQEVFIAAHQKWQQFRQESSVKTWLYAIAVNTCRSYLRKRKTQRALKNTWASLQSLLWPTPQPEETVLQQMAHDTLWTAVDRLSEKHRLPILLHYVHDLPAADIGHILGISQGTVYSRLHYARNQIQAALIHAHKAETDQK